TFSLSATGFANSTMPTTTAALVVTETSPPQADQDHVLMLTDLGPGPEGGQAKPAYRLNGQPNFEIPMKSNERLRLRFVNACQRRAVALQISGHDPQVIAMDSRPSEPFPARDGRLVLAPGGRIDTMIDASARPGTI